VAARKKPPTEADQRAGIQPSVRVFTLWTPPLIRAAEIQADAGNLRQAASLCDWILADDRAGGALRQRVQALMGLEPTFEASVSSDKRRSGVAIKALDAKEDWWAAYPESELSQIDAWGLLLGVAPARQRWDVFEDHGGRVLPVPEFWHPQHLRQDQATREWKIRVARSGLDTGTEETLVPGDGTWMLHTPYGRNRPWAWGLWRGLAPLVLLKHLAFTDWAIHGEKGALLVGTEQRMPNSGLQTPGESTKDLRQALANDLYQRGRDGVAILPAGFDLKLVEASANTRNIYEAQINMANEAITIAIRGGNLTTSVQGGSRAAAEVQERLGDNVNLRFDAQSLTTTVHDQSLVWWAEFNFGDRKLAPWPVYPVEEEEDLKAKVESEEKAFTVVKQAEDLGFEVDRTAFLEEHKITWAKPGAKPVPPKQPPTPPVPTPANGEPAPAAQPASGEPPAPPSKSGAKQEPPKAALFTRLASGFLATKASGFINSQLATDAIVEGYSVAAVTELEATIAAVLEELDAATDYEDLRERLRARYEQLDPEQLSELVRKALLLGELAGMAGTNEDA
jgi:phage gp29-like protein